MNFRRHILGCSLLVGGALLHTSTASAQLLSERLVPPQQVVLPPVPMVAQPAEPRVFGAEKPKSHLWALPFGTFPGSPTVLTTELRSVDWFRPALDVPVLASEADPFRPAFPLQPTADRAYAAGPNPSKSPELVRFPLPAELQVLASDDPSANAAFTLLTNGVPLAVPNSPDLLRLSVPDPFEYLRTVRLANPPAEANDPATAQDRPPLVKLPMVEPPKEP